MFLQNNPYTHKMKNGLREFATYVVDIATSRFGSGLKNGKIVEQRNAGQVYTKGLKS